MTIFRWQGVGPNGATVKGEMDAPDAAAVAARLRVRRIRPLPDRIRTKGSGLNREITILGLGGKGQTKRRCYFHPSVGDPDQCRPAHHAGPGPPGPADVKIKPSPGVIATVKHEVESGSAFAESLTKHPKVFDELYTNMVSAGEVGGMLDTILTRLAAYMEKVVKLKSKVKSALLYPLSIISVAVLVTALLLIYVIPSLVICLPVLARNSPLPTQIALNLSGVARAYCWYMVAGIIGAVFGIRTYYRTERGRRVVDGVLLKLPVFGDIFRKAAVARFTRTLSTLVSSGVPILDSLAITGKTAGNKNH